MNNDFILEKSWNFSTTYHKIRSDKPPRVESDIVLPPLETTNDKPTSVPQRSDENGPLPVGNALRFFNEAKFHIENEIKPLQLWKAKYKETYEKVVIKAKTLKNEEDEKHKTLLRALQHENIVRLLGESTNYFVFQKCEVSLDYVIKERSVKFTKRDAYMVILNMAIALQYLHNLDYVHRDICIYNIVFTEKHDGRFFEAKLASLDSVCKSGEKKRDKKFRNLPVDFHLTSKSDMWALGIVTLEVFTRWMDFRSPYPNPSMLDFALDTTLLLKNHEERLEAKQIISLVSRILHPQSPSEEANLELEIARPQSIGEVETLCPSERRENSWNAILHCFGLNDDCHETWLRNRSKSLSSLPARKIASPAAHTMSTSGN